MLTGLFIEAVSHLNVALLLGAVLEEGIHELWVNKVPCIKTIKDLVTTVMSNASKNRKTGDKDRVIVVAKGSILD